MYAVHQGGITGAFSVRQEGVELTSVTVRRRSIPHTLDSRSMSPDARRSLSEDRNVASWSTTSFTSTATLPRILLAAVHSWYVLLRQAHVAATRQQAIERPDRLREPDRGGRYLRCWSNNSGRWEQKIERTGASIQLDGFRDSQCPMVHLASVTVYDILGYIILPAPICHHDHPHRRQSSLRAGFSIPSPTLIQARSDV